MKSRRRVNSTVGRLKLMLRIIATVVTVAFILLAAQPPAACSQQISVSRGRVIIRNECPYSVAIPRGWTPSPDGQQPDAFDVAFAQGNRGREGHLLLGVIRVGRAIETVLSEDTGTFIPNRGRPIRTLDRHLAHVRYLYSQHEGCWVAEALVSCNGRVATVVLSAYSRRDFTRSLPTWRTLVRSFRHENAL
ncbi:MAG: hypothetical protein ACT4OT_11855 [Acidobacteriota bacterium]